MEYYPALCFTEVWKELPDEYCKNATDPVRYKVFMSSQVVYYSGGTDGGICIPYKGNPTDALIELLIWVKGEGEMTPEQLNMIKRLQPKIRAMMVEWQEGDDVYQESFGIGIIINTSVTNLRTIITVYYTSIKDVIVYDQETLNDFPKPIDWQNEKRGLWGMLFDKSNFIRNLDMYYPLKLAYMNDPFTALLKALIEQEGV